ncbi:MAG: putative lipid II flippase FtsW [Endomicrobiaceae bacterium]|nr:putative lipid II flippase FtsW [Endomicrobiaceae bacterium]
MQNNNPNNKPNINKLKHTNNNNISILLVCVVVLLAFGILAVQSCSNMVNLNSPYDCITKHLVNICIGFVAFIVAYFINYKKYQNKNLLFFIITTILLILPIFFPEHKGAHRWIELKFFSFQPSELAKLVLVIIMADFINRNKAYINTWEKNIFPAIYVAVFCPIILLLQKDLGSTALIFALWAIMLFIAKIDTKRILIIVLIAVLGVTVAIAIKPYRRTRVITYITHIAQTFSGNAEEVEEKKVTQKKLDDDTYNAEMSYAAFGSGGLFGKGPGKSETKLRYLPEKQTDYIFSIIGEEYGLLFGTIIILSVFFVFTFIALSIHNKCPDDFGKYLSFGIILIITGQALINMGMTTGVLPSKGFPLPFISYGGSSMLLNSYMLGILINIERNNKKQL